MVYFCTNHELNTLTFEIIAGLDQSENLEFEISIDSNNTEVRDLGEKNIVVKSPNMEHASSNICYRSTKLLYTAYGMGKEQLWWGVTKYEDHLPKLISRQRTWLLDL